MNTVAEKRNSWIVFIRMLRANIAPDLGVSQS